MTKDTAVQCDFWIHIECNNCNDLDYRYLQNCDESWYCTECCSKIFPFKSLSNKKFLACCTSTDNNIIQQKDPENEHTSSLSLKTSSNIELLVNQFNNATPDNSNEFEKISSSRYYDIEEMHNMEIPDNNKSLSLFHINSCSLKIFFDDLRHLLSFTKRNFDVIAISETRITK